MPIYEYECNSCRFRFTLKQDFSDDPIDTCPECQGPVRRLIHPVGIVFKGSGFYVTDHRKKEDAGGEAVKPHEGDKVKEASPSKAEEKA